NMIIGLIGILTLYASLFKEVFTKKTRVIDTTISTIVIVIVLGIPAILTHSNILATNMYESIHKEEVDEAKPLDKDATPIVVSPEFARNKIQKSMSVVPNTQFYDLG